jgi:hypothetical protein
MMILFNRFRGWFKRYGKYKLRKRSIQETSNNLSSEDILWSKLDEFPPIFEERVPSYVAKAYRWFAGHIFISDELKGLKFISIQRFKLAKDSKKAYIWHKTNHLMTTNYKEERTVKMFSYSVVILDQCPQKLSQLETDRDRWISLFLYGSQMTEKEAQMLFGDEPMFQEIFKMLKLRKGSTLYRGFNEILLLARS